MPRHAQERLVEVPKSILVKGDYSYILVAMVAYTLAKKISLLLLSNLELSTHHLLKESSELCKSLTLMLNI